MAGDDSSRAFKKGAVLIGGSCLALWAVMAIANSPSAVESTSLFGVLPRFATPGAIMPKPRSAGWHTANVRPNAPSRSVTVAAFQNEEVAKRYAKALFESSPGAKLEEVHDALESMRVAMVDVPDLKKVLESPVESAATRGKIIDGLIKQKEANKFLKVLIGNGRSKCLVEAIEAFDGLYAESVGLVTAKVTSAKELSEQEQFKIAKKIQQLVGCTSVKIKPVVDKKLIGGYVIEWASERLDLSYRGKLDIIKKQLESADFTDLVKR